MRPLLLVALVACAPLPAPAKPKACPPPEPPAPVATLPALDEAQVEERALAFLTAMSARDGKAFDELAATSFVSFVYGRTYDRKTISSRFATKQPGEHPDRRCNLVQTRIGPTSAVFTAECTDRYPAHDDMPAYEAVGMYSIVLVAEGAGGGPGVAKAWKIAYSSYQTSSVEAERDLWNDTFQRGAGFRKEANQHLLDAVRGKKPGKALDIAMGQGRNVLALAALGWKVTGVDISDAGIKLAKAAAAKQQLAFEAVVQDIDTYDLGTAKWDLITLIYAGNDPKLVERIKRAVRPGGLVVVEFFHTDAVAGSGIGSFATGELAKHFADWKILKDEVVEDLADWGLRKTKLVRFTAQRP